MADASASNRRVAVPSHGPLGFAADGVCRIHALRSADTRTQPRRDVRVGAGAGDAETALLRGMLLGARHLSVFPSRR